ncbi:NOL1/NOP2/sun family protein [Besnoitia besnoiti]|uniref:NOL1/NOP2/sun family protein n=1 Tax=Besnoitia besnoiti TaxID=94643 RepID=A0A2A9ME57_BESBE|nr:NOL1/NOP2/sun family protein [Besnoitia besnoiti]PFH33953.1 NOL1/NOP2/sun family protein [Besnoitia besnoiti]
MAFPASSTSVRHLLDSSVYSLLKASWPSPLPSGRSVDWVLDQLLVPPPVTTLRVNAVGPQAVEEAIVTAEEFFRPRAVRRHPLLDDVLIISHEACRPPERAAATPGVAESISETQLGAAGSRGGECRLILSEDGGKSLNRGTHCRGCPEAGDAAAVARAQQAAHDRGSEGCTAVHTNGETLPRDGMQDRQQSGKYPLILVDRRCGQAVLRGAHVFSAGVLASEPHLRVGAVVEVYTLPRRLRQPEPPEGCHRAQRADTRNSVSPPSPTCGCGGDCRLAQHREPRQHLQLARERQSGENLRELKCTRGTEPESSEAGDSGTYHNDDWGLSSILRGTYLRASLPERVRRSGLFCGRGILHQNLGEVYAKKEGVAIEMEGAIDLSSLPSCLVAQNLPSIVVGHVLAPQPGEKVLDMCAAPGGKTLHLATLMKGQGWIVAVERSKTRTQKLRRFLASSPHAAIVEAVCGDSAKATWKSARIQKEAVCGQCLDGYFDRVLADVPCTALGLRPRIDFEGLDAAAVLSAAAYQREFLATGCRLLKTGGTLVYSTCSISKEENEGNVAWALAHLPLVLEPAAPFVGSRTVECVDAATRLLSAADAEKLQRFCPSADSIGFFIAKFRKTTVQSSVI